jgi:predicted RNA-binding protein with PUA-like domain
MTKSKDVPARSKKAATKSAPAKPGDGAKTNASPKARPPRGPGRAYWLVKSEPQKWSWNDQVAAGPKGTLWDGVKNHTAKLNLMDMRLGDQAFFYHSNEGKEIVGIVEVIAEAHPDPKLPPGEPWVVVDFKAVRALKKPVTLAQVKATPALKDMALIASFRLSVQPVTAEEWTLVLAMSEA